MLTFAGILASVATIVSGGIWAFKWIANKVKVTPEQSEAKIDAEIQAEKASVENGGRPSWD